MGSHDNQHPDTDGPVIHLEVRFVVRRPTLDDAPAVTGLINICTMMHTDRVPLTVDRLRAQWQSPGFDLNKHAWLACTPQGQVVGWAELYPDNACGPILWLYVHPAYTGQGIGGYLLQLAEAWACQMAAVAGRLDRANLRTVTVSDDRAARRLFHSQGFELVDRFWRGDTLLSSDTLIDGVPIIGRDMLGAGDGPAVGGIPTMGDAAGSRRTFYRYDIYEKML